MLKYYFSLLTLINGTTTVTLNGRGSYDPDGVIVNYNWSQVSGPSSTILTPDSYLTKITDIKVIGDYKYRLIVTDNKGAKDTAYTTVIVYSNQAPVIKDFHIEYEPANPTK